MVDKEQEFTSIEPAQDDANAEHKEMPQEDEEAEALLQKEIDGLKSALNEKIKEAEENYKRFLLVCADLENYKKRADREKEGLVTFANEQLIKGLIPVVDNLERALEHIPVLKDSNSGNQDADVNALRDGVKLTLDQFLAILKKFGLEQISSVGERFNPNKHEAINHEENGDYEPDTVVKEYQKGYFLKERLLRPAMVVVSKKPEGAGAAQNPI